MDKEESRLLLWNTVRKILSEHPDLAGDASLAINAGVQEALTRIQQESRASDLAMLAALALLPPSRITEGSRAMLESVVRQAINVNHMCPAERSFMEKTS